MTEKKYVPTEPGWYWYRDEDAPRWEPVFVEPDCTGVWGVDMGLARSTLDDCVQCGTFHPGPLQPPEESNE